MMADTTARLRVGKMNFETKVDLDNAIKMRRGEDVNVSDVIKDTTIWTDLKKGLRPGQDELMNAFGSISINEIVPKIVKKGDIEVTQEFRDEAMENKKKQVVDFLSKNAIDARSDRPFTPDIIESAIKEAGVRIDNTPIEKQMSTIIVGLNKIIPIKIEKTKIKIKIQAQHTGQVYGLINEYKEKENWLDNGDLEVIVKVPSGMKVDFYDKLNGVTHGSALTEEVKE
jgi:ribosome maturation protein SDO1